MTKILLKYSVVLIVGLFCSCQRKIEKQIIGTWVVDDAVIYNEKTSKFNFMVNMMTFKNDERCSLPIRKIEEIETGQWFLRENNGDTYLHIVSENVLYNDSFKVDMQVREGKSLKMDLSSNKVILHCTKFGVNY